MLETGKDMDPHSREMLQTFVYGPETKFWSTLPGGTFSQ